MKRIREMFRDWWRGYTDTDVTILRMKLKQCKPGGFIQISRRESNIIRAGILHVRTSNGLEVLEVTRSPRQQYQITPRISEFPE